MHNGSSGYNTRASLFQNQTVHPARRQRIVTFVVARETRRILYREKDLSCVRAARMISEFEILGRSIKPIFIQEIAFKGFP